MMNYTAGRVSKCRGSIIGLLMSAIMILTFCQLPGIAIADSLFTPSLALSGSYDDNILFSRTNTEDDYIYYIQPGATYKYKQEVTQFFISSLITARRYHDTDELDDELYRVKLDGRSNITERLRLDGEYIFIKDTTLDSELDEIGRIFTRDDRYSHEARLAPTYNLTERLSIGLNGRYRDVAYDAEEFVDYTVWQASLPLTWRLVTQIDSIYVSPGYVNRDSDTLRSDSYNLIVGWQHETTERLNMNLYAGARQTEIEQVATGETEKNWAAIGKLQFEYDFETSKITIGFLHDLTNTADGDQVNLSRLLAELQWNLTERFQMEIEGGYYHSKTERENATDNTTERIKAGLKLVYNMTENHDVFIKYNYTQVDQDEFSDDPRAEKNRILAGIQFNFPIQ